MAPNRFSIALCRHETFIWENTKAMGSIHHPSPPPRHHWDPRPGSAPSGCAYGLSLRHEGTPGSPGWGFTPRRGRKAGGPDGPVEPSGWDGPASGSVPWESDMGHLEMGPICVMLVFAPGYRGQSVAGIGRPTSTIRRGKKEGEPLITNERQLFWTG